MTWTPTTKRRRILRGAGPGTCDVCLAGTCASAMVFVGVRRSRRCYMHEIDRYDGKANWR